VNGAIRLFGYAVATVSPRAVGGADGDRRSHTAARTLLIKPCWARAAARSEASPAHLWTHLRKSLYLEHFFSFPIHSLTSSPSCVLVFAWGHCDYWGLLTLVGFLRVKIAQMFASERSRARRFSRALRRPLIVSVMSDLDKIRSPV